jgi:hypothetical protein
VAGQRVGRRALARVATPGRLLAIAAGAAALEVVALFIAWRHAFGDGHPLCHGQGRPGAHAILWLGGLTVTIAALAATYLALRRSRWAACAAWLAAAFPLAILGVASIYASCLLRSWF